MDNLLLRALPEADLEALQPHLETDELPRGAAIALPGKPVQHAHFLERGFVSILIQIQDRTMEIGLVGREGMLGAPAVLGSELADYRAVVREDVLVQRMDVAQLRQLMLQRRAIGALFLRYIQVGVAQITHTAFAGAQLTIAQRLARWLLMAHDRVDGDTVRVTHLTLSDALGVQRSGITLALQELKAEGAIQSYNRAITIVDREILIAKTMGAYGPAERAFKALLGGSLSRS